MKASKKFWFSICLILLTTILVGSCVCVYLFNLNQVAYWWSILVASWVLEIIIATILFNGKHMADESKAFWLLVLLFVPYFGALIVLFIGFDKYKYNVGDSSNLTFILRQLFTAKKSIKIHTNSFFVPQDIFNVLNFVSFKNVDIQIIISKQKQKLRQKLLIRNINKYFETQIKINFLKTKTEQNFIIIDDEKVLITEQNFNFKNLYSLTKISESYDCLKQLQQFNEDLNKTKRNEINKSKLPLIKRCGFAIANIFYLFY